MLFILFFAVMSVALPIVGEVWRNGSNNVLTRSGQEANEIIVDLTADLRTQLRTAATRLEAVTARLVFASVGLLLLRLARVAFDFLARVVMTFFGN
jgi:hypothetical protein